MEQHVFAYACSAWQLHVVVMLQNQWLGVVAGDLVCLIRLCELGIGNVG